MENKYLLKALEILGKEIYNLQLDCEVKDYELKEVRNKLKSVEKYIEKLEVENGK
jgi:hypothetical protein